MNAWRERRTSSPIGQMLSAMLLCLGATLSAPPAAAEPCGQLDAAAIDFLKDPADYQRDGVSYKAVKQSNPTGIFPDGPRPFIAGHGASTANHYKAMADAGFTVVSHSYGATQDKANVYAVADTGMKLLYSMRDHRPPFDPGAAQGDRSLLAEAGRAGVGSPQMKELEKVMRGAIDWVRGDSKMSETVIGWTHNFDDALSNKNHKLCQYSPPPAAKVPCDISDYRRAANHLYTFTQDHDLNSHNKKSHVCDLPGSNSDYRSRAVLKLNPWQDKLTIWAGQRYWGYKSGGLSRSTCEIWHTRGFLWHWATIYSKLAKDAATPAAPNGKARIYAPLIWSNNLPGNIEIPRLRNDAFFKKNLTANVLINLIAGANGTYVYQLINSHTATALWFQRMKKVTASGVMDALLWGPDKADIKKQIVDDPMGRYRSADCLNLSSTCTDGELGTGWAKDREMDHVLWKSTQFRGKRYLVVTNMQKHREEHAFFPTSTGPEPKNYTIKSRFVLPAGLKHVKCTEVLSGAEVDISSGAIEVTLDPVESAIYVFEPQDGWCTEGKECTVDEDCDDNDPCTRDRCDLQSDTCLNELNGGCPAADTGITEADSGGSAVTLADSGVLPLGDAGPPTSTLTPSLEGGCSIGGENTRSWGPSVLFFVLLLLGGRARPRSRRRSRSG